MVHPVPCDERQRCITLISLFNLDPRSGCVANTTPRRSTPWEDLVSVVQEAG